MAFEAISAFHQRHALVQKVMDDRVRALGATAADRALALELASGVVRRQATLDCLLPEFVNQPRAAIEDPVWSLLQLGAYQLLLTEIPAHAAVSETVEVAQQIQRPAWARFVNAVLRNVSQIATNDFFDQPGPDRIPVSEGKYRQIRRPLLPDPLADNLMYLTKGHSFPRWLIRDWVARHGEEETARLCFWFNRAPAATLRVNLLRQSRDRILERLAEEGFGAAAGGFDESIRLERSVNVTTLPGFTEGWFSIQDDSAMAAGHLLEPRSGETLLDLCAAPGGKTTHLAELMRNEGTIVAADADPDRLRTVSENAGRLGLSMIQTVSVSPTGEGLPPGPFDAALVDVPCSNTGVLGKRPEARWRISSEGIDGLVSTQHRLLRQAIERVRAGGRIVYSTCSIEPRENRELVHSVIGGDASLELIREVEHIPGRPADGGYQALILRRD